MVKPILTWPDPRLKLTSGRVGAVDDKVRSLVKDMIETMLAANGVGLAAIQIGSPLRIFVSKTPNQVISQVYINPVVFGLGSLQLVREGCLSVPGVSELVERHVEAQIVALDLEGQFLSVVVRGLEAQIAQHEQEHLNGEIFLEHLSPLKQKLIEAKLATL